MLLGWSCGRPAKQPRYTIGFSQCTTADAWRQFMHREMERELYFHPEVDLVIRDAERNNTRQIAQIDSFIQEGIDLLIVTPNEATPLTPAVERAYASGIPVIVVDRRINSNQYTAYIGSDNYEIGRTAAHYVGELLGGTGKIFEIWGLRGSTPAIDRHRGFVEVLRRDYPKINIIAEIEGQWERDTARALFPGVLEKHPEVDLVFAHNDVMAQGAYQVSHGTEAGANLRFVGVDGLPGPTGGLSLVADGTLSATLLYPTGGPQAIQQALDILADREVPRETLLQTTLINPVNVSIMQQQTDRLLDQQRDIERQQLVLDEQIELYRSQRALIVFITVLLVLALLLGGVAFLNLRERQDAYRQLATRNEKISRQRDQIKAMAKETERANRAKFEFFTNISHELRTPLTLVVGPIDKLLEQTQDLNDRFTLELIRRNAQRLLRLINQLMDFRKLESGKMRLRAQHEDIIAFIRSVVAAFDFAAQQRGIDLQVTTELPQLPVWFDVEKLDKVLFNLLSNAMKFTPDHGWIHVRISRDPVAAVARIEVADNGRGMPPEHAAHAFERFYQGAEYSSQGTGLGLSLSKQLIELHRGHIRVRSQLERGTTFTIELPLSGRHLLPEEKQAATAHTPLELIPLVAKPSQRAEPKPVGVADEKHPLVLIAEDNLELLDFLHQELGGQYRILTAADGLTARELAFERLPDLILTDVMMPGLDGIKLTRELKNDLRTSHIPIILLTARSETDHRLEGEAVGADDYLAKPFDIHLLIARIDNLLRNRRRLRDRYVNQLETSIDHEVTGLEDRAFLAHFTALVEKHLGNNEYRVEDLSRELGISRVHLYRRIKDLLDISVGDYIQQVRLKRAKHLLRSSSQNISDIAYSLGFSSPAYFSTAFKTAFEVTPSAYRRKQTV